MTTMEQIKNWESKLKNGFEFNLRHFLYHKEKEVMYKEKISDTEYNLYNLEFWERREGFKWVEGYDIKINKSTWHVTSDDMATSYGLGKTITYKENACNKKLYNVLVKCTEELTLDKLHELFTNVVEDNYGGILA